MSTSLVGQPVDRVDGWLKVTGQATYSAEFKANNLAYGVAVESTVGKGRISSIDTRLAKKAPGILDVLTHLNAMQVHFPKDADPSEGGLFENDLLPLQGERIFYEGQHVAVVIAETLEQAEHAATLVQVRYEVQPPAIALKQNLSASYLPINGPADPAQNKRGDVGPALKKAAVTVNETYTTPLYHHNAMELHGTMAEWKGDALTVYEPTQRVTGSRNLIAMLFGLPKEKVRLICYYLGGGFGGKGGRNYTYLTVMAAKLVNRPVKLVLSRQLVFASCGRRPQTIQQIELGADATGKLAAIRHETTTDTSFVQEFVEPSGISTPIVYNSPNVEVIHHLVRLNKGTPCSMRAPEEATGSFGMEVAMDELAYKLHRLNAFK